MYTKFGPAGMVDGGGSHTQYRITPVPILGAGALMLNTWDWTVTIRH